MSHFDHHTNQCELEVQRINHLQNLANQLPNAFIEIKRVTKSHIPTMNALARIDLPEGQLTNESQICLKHRRPIGSKDITPRNKRTQRRIDTSKELHDKKKAHVEVYDKQKAPKEVYGNKGPLQRHISNNKPLKKLEIKK